MAPTKPLSRRAQEVVFKAYKTATELESGNYKAWHCWAMVSHVVAIFVGGLSSKPEKQEARTGFQGMRRGVWPGGGNVVFVWKRQAVDGSGGSCRHDVSVAWSSKGGVLRRARVHMAKQGLAPTGRAEGLRCTRCLTSHVRVTHPSHARSTAEAPAASRSLPRHVKYALAGCISSESRRLGSETMPERPWCPPPVISGRVASIDLPAPPSQANFRVVELILQGNNRHAAGSSHGVSTGASAASGSAAAGAAAADAPGTGSSTGMRRTAGPGGVGTAIGGGRGLGLGLGLGNQQHGKYTDNERLSLKVHLVKAADGFIRAINLGRKKWSALVQQVCCLPSPGFVESWAGPGER